MPRKNTAKNTGEGQSTISTDELHARLSSLIDDEAAEEFPTDVPVDTVPAESHTLVAYADDAESSHDGHREQTNSEPGSRTRARRTSRGVMDKGTEEANRAYAIKRFRESIWYRLRKAGFAISKPGTQTEGFRLDSKDATVRVTHYVPSPDGDQAPAVNEESIERARELVSRYADTLAAHKYMFVFEDIDGRPYVCIDYDTNTLLPEGQATGTQLRVEQAEAEPAEG